MYYFEIIINLTVLPTLPDGKGYELYPFRTRIELLSWVLGI